MMGVCFDEVRSSLESGKQLVWNGCNDKSVSECRSNGYLHSEARTGLLRLTSRSRRRSGEWLEANAKVRSRMGSD